MCLNPKNKLHKNKPKHVLYFSETICLMEMFSSFSSLNIYLSLREKHTMAKTTVQTSTLMQKRGFHNVQITLASKIHPSNLHML